MTTITTMASGMRTYHITCNGIYDARNGARIHAPYTRVRVWLISRRQGVWKIFKILLTQATFTRVVTNY